ncbi:hypothetical protein L210DRAFT_3040820 [Boletus edulis BED1]|uniref:Uncharacterized protein n=1 Tax=Boletus edulis BED1 TaxID=1328754 RepID=A0AAD4C0T4_BOLED|nr:hypothetical protein L210DRAFT_3040820 [Boletus edulis BED1]
MIYTPKKQSIFHLTSLSPSPSTPSDSERARSLTRRSSLTPVTSPTRAPLIQDGSYLEALGLRLNEAVAKALAHPSGPSRTSELVRGRCPIPAGRGRVMGKLVASELQAARDDKHLYRAVLRAVQKPLSVLLSNLSALLLPLLSSPAFLQPPVPTVQMPNPNATQLHALGIADFAGELLSTFDDTALGIETDSRGDGLQPIRAGLVSLIGRVVTPLITGIKEALIPLLDALEIPDNTTPHKAKGSVHPSITALQSSVPVYGRALARYATTYHSDTLLASFLISIVWRALVALSHRPMMTQSATSVILSEKCQYPSSPRDLSPTGLFNLKRGSSRSASLVTPSTAVADAKALYEIFSQFPRPTHTQVAREAVEEAFAHLETLMSLLAIAGDPFFVVNRTAEEIADEIHGLTDDLPTLIALPVLLRVQYFGGVLEPQVNTVAAFLNIPEDIYRKDCLAGFGRAEQWGPVLAHRALDEIYAGPVVDSPTCFVDWLEDRLGQNDH